MGNMDNRVIIHIDGGSRGNPGPAAAGVVVRAADDGIVLHEAGLFLGKTTNNVAEYRGLLAALEAATRLNVTHAEVFSDSELLVRQMNGQYRVKKPHLRKLFEQAKEMADAFDGFKIAHVRREKNADADRLVNRALDLKRDVDAADL